MDHQAIENIWSYNQTTLNNFKTMKKKITPQQNAANMTNRNRGTSETNRQYDQNQGNRGQQLNPTHKK